MQRDYKYTFGEIHGTKEALLESVEDIISSFSVATPEDEPLRLRFVTPLHLDEWEAGWPCRDWTLTLPHEHAQIKEYITVSYVWAHEESTYGLPDYRIFDPISNVPRPVKCHKAVFHRAMQYAREECCPYVWIDQECIHQEFPEDLERHIQIMHRVYARSCSTVAVLATPLRAEPGLLDGFFQAIHKSESDGQTPLSPFSVLKMLQTLAEDPWFKRTWAFQEKNCAAQLDLLFTTRTWGTVYSHRDGKENYLDMALIHEWITNNIEEIPKDLDQLHTDLEDLAVTFVKPTRTVPFSIARGYASVYPFYALMALCNNAVFVDRVSIFANVCRFPLRLLAAEIDQERYSYSTCILAMVMVNFHPSKEARAAAMFSRGHDRILSLRISQVLRSVVDDKPIAPRFAGLSSSQHAKGYLDYGGW